jgi:hypothetical protein
MSFLSLGLSKDEQQDEVLRANSTTDAPVLLHQIDDPTLLQEQEDDRIEVDDGDSAVSPPTSFANPEEDEEPEEEVSALPPAIEELRQKISGNGYKPAFRRVINDYAPTFGTFKFGYLPGRGLLYSIIGHEVVLFGLFLIVHYGLPSLRPQKLITNTQDHLVYLPEVGGGQEGEKSPGGGQSAPRPSSAAPAHASRGFAYPGRQAILSDPPNPTNAFQTVQRPLLVHPAPLNKLVPLPNIVQMAETRLPSDLIAPRPAMPQFQPVPEPIKVKQDASTRRQAPWKVPVNDAPRLVAKAEMPKLPAAEEPLPDSPKIRPQPKQEEEKREVEKPSPNPIKVTVEKRAEKSQKEVAPLTPAQVARMEMHGKAPEPLISLSPMPLPPGTNAKIPAGEARGRFAIAPGGKLNPNSITPGKNNGTPSISPATGNDKSQSADSAAEASNTGKGAGQNSSAGGGSGSAKAAEGVGSAGTGTGSGGTSGDGAGGAGTGKGRGAAGKGSGATAGRGAGTGSGGGSGPGSGAFQGITIQGGEGNAADPPAFTVAPETPYAMTVVSTASSGGGLEDYGVFDDERVFTVYIPMKRAPEEADPTWTLQYAMLKEDGVAAAGQQGLLAPMPVMREWPQVPADLEKKYAQRQVVVFAVVDKEGKVTRISVKQTPDVQVSDPIVRALSKWVFRPAQLNNQPVAVKVLLGIPL